MGDVQKEHEIDRIHLIKVDEVLIRWKNGEVTWEQPDNVKGDITEMLKAYPKG